MLEKVHKIILVFFTVMVSNYSVSSQVYVTPMAGATQTFNVVGGEIFTDPIDGAGQGGVGGDCSATSTNDGVPGNYPIADVQRLRHYVDR
jgi:hypothetical protein